MPRSSPLQVEEQAESTLRKHDNYEELGMIGIGEFSYCCCCFFIWQYCCTNL